MLHDTTNPEIHGNYHEYRPAIIEPANTVYLAAPRNMRVLYT